MSQSNESILVRRQPLGPLARAATAAVLLAAMAATGSKAGEEGEPIDIGSRRELFVGGFLVDRLSGEAELVMHHPEPREISLVHDAPWEGSGCGYHSVFQDGDLYRMYYKAWHLAFPGGKLKTDVHPLYTCYAESDDGIHWRKPELGLHEFNGSKKNNIVLTSESIGDVNPDAGHIAVFKDPNPNCAPEARYKAIVRSRKPHGLLAFGSPDGLHFKPLADRPVITNGAFDSQNLAFWDPASNVYRAYWRYFTKGTTTGDQWRPSGVRAIRTATSDDFLHWSNEKDLTYVDSPPEQLYTNQVKAYERAPHILIGFPTRYIDRGWSPSMRALPELKHREMRADASRRYGTAITEGLLMSSRDSVHFKRWNEAFLPPGIERAGTWHYGQQYIAWHVVQTQSKLEDAPDELSLYATESYWTGDSSEVRRYTLRLDGFVSVHAPLKGGEMVTRPVKFDGNTLRLNFSTSAAGSIRVGLHDAAGQPISGFTCDDCNDVFGDEIDRKVTWKGGADVSALAGKPVRIRFMLRDADVYSFRFAAQ